MTSSERSATDEPTLDELDPSIDGLFDALSNARRRFVLAYLRNGSSPADLDELAAEIAQWERDAASDDVESVDPANVAVSLYHWHLPKLADVGLVTFSRERHTVALTGIGATCHQLVPLPPIE